jgi:signal transduction histidine kinase
VARDVSDRKRTEQALRDLSGRLLQIQDEERRHIARELHDSTAQRLAVLECNLRLLQQRSPGLEPAMRQNLEQSVALGGECSNELRTLAYLLHPPLLDELGLASALRAYISGHNQRHGIFVSLKLPRRLPRLGSDLEIAIFRIVQEALSNIHRHSKSKTAKIRLSASPCKWILEVSDQGQGIAPDILERLNEGTAILGVGIAGMRERVRQLGGRLEILSSRRGTTVRSVFPRRDPSAVASVTPRNNPSHPEQMHSVSHYAERSRRKTA